MWFVPFIPTTWTICSNDSDEIKNAMFAMIQQQQEAKNESNEIKKTMVAMMQQQQELLIVLNKIVEM